MKRMAHPNTLRYRLGSYLPALTVAIILIVAALLSYQNAPVASAADTPSSCTSSMKTVTSRDPAKQAIMELRGPAYATIWVNYDAVSSGAAWNIAKKNPPWGQTEVRVRIDWGVEVNAYWAGGTFVQYAQNADCQLKMVADFNADSRPVKTLDALRQWGILSYWHVGKS